MQYPVKFVKNFIVKQFKNSKKVVFPGRVKCGGTEGEIVVAHGCRKRKKLICGTEEEIVVAHGHLPSPARMVRCLGWGGIFEVWYNKC